MARRSAGAVHAQWRDGRTLGDVVTDEPIENAMIVHAAFGGSTNLLLHIPAIAHAAGLRRPTVDDWIAVNRRCRGSSTRCRTGRQPSDGARLPRRRRARGDAAPARLGLLHLDALTVDGRALGDVLDGWEAGERRARSRPSAERDGIDPDDVIMPRPARAREGITSTVTFPRATSRPRLRDQEHRDRSRALDADGVYRQTARARVFTSERDAIAAIKSRG